jgi:hypothetical protein
VPRRRENDKSRPNQDRYTRHILDFLYHTDVIRPIDEAKFSWLGEFVRAMIGSGRVKVV